VNGYQFVLAVARVALRQCLRLRRVRLSLSVTTLRRVRLSLTVTRTLHTDDVDEKIRIAAEEDDVLYKQVVTSNVVH